jgi:catechol 2,3-dioxygenase-like lactoylglutathione lyase family enzyme
MAAQLNHTIVAAHDNEASAQFFVDVLGLPSARLWGPFWMIETGNGVSLDFMQVSGDIAPQHYAFLISEPEFDEIFERIRARGEYWADPMQSRPGEINHNDGGRGVYFEDPNGHLLEIITRPYGSGQD